ncbi:hypothetical protein AC578_394 [Pseudocercospora eumusae]|uniref:F-box domain-containing protein n=1 Tax=Pseudocercospora eumusae TaxID=321146 RepID=A0A139HTT4_9PEZI|nr:hypothetical protein AC578_394 [Pseudocercospora eumusae]
MASSKVFGSVELLESILLHMDMLELLRVQRVCRHWRDVLQRSPQLQRRTFLGFVPRTGDLSKFVYSNFVAMEGSVTLPGPSPAEPLICGAPRITSARNMLDPTKKRAVHFNPVFPSLDNVIRLSTAQFRTPLESRQSWFDMFLTRPPTSCVHITLYYTFNRTYCRKILFHVSRRAHKTTATYNLVLKRAEGIRARDVLTELKKTALQGADSNDWQRIDIQIPGVARDDIKITIPRLFVQD